MLASVVTGFVSILAFASFADIAIGTGRSTVLLKICTTIAGIKKIKSVIKKKKKNIIK